jgi:hypothetical protein
MFDLSKPVGNDVIILSIGFIFVIIVIGLGVVKYYKNRLLKEQK